MKSNKKGTYTGVASRSRSKNIGGGQINNIHGRVSPTRGEMDIQTGRKKNSSSKINFQVRGTARGAYRTKFDTTKPKEDIELNNGTESTRG